MFPSGGKIKGFWKIWERKNVRKWESLFWWSGVSQIISNSQNLPTETPCQSHIKISQWICGTPSHQNKLSHFLTFSLFFFSASCVNASTHTTKIILHTHSFFISFFQGVNTISLQFLRDLREEEREEERESLLWKIGVSQIHWDILMWLWLGFSDGMFWGYSNVKY